MFGMCLFILILELLLIMYICICCLRRIESWFPSNRERWRWLGQRVFWGAWWQCTTWTVYWLVILCIFNVHTQTHTHTHSHMSNSFCSHPSSCYPDLWAWSSSDRCYHTSKRFTTSEQSSCGMEQPWTTCWRSSLARDRGTSDSKCIFFSYWAIIWRACQGPKIHLPWPKVYLPWFFAPFFFWKLFIN